MSSASAPLDSMQPDQTQPDQTQPDQTQPDQAQPDQAQQDETPRDAKHAFSSGPPPTQWNFVNVSANDFILIAGKRKTGRTTFGRQLVTAFGLAGLATTKHQQNTGARQPVADCKKAGPDPVDKSSSYRRSNQTETLMTWWTLRKLFTNGGTLNGKAIAPNKDYSAANAAVVLVDDIESIADTAEEHSFYCDLLQYHAAYNVLVVATSTSIQDMYKIYNVFPTWTAILKPSLKLPQDRAAVCSALCGPSDAAWCATIDACNYRGAVWYQKQKLHEGPDLSTLSFCHGVDTNTLQ